MTIRHLQIFRTVCECGSITAAADRLNVTQPSVSIAIKELEDYYRTKLFDRASRKIYLTEPGETLLGYTHTLLDEFDEAAALLRDGSTFTRCRLGVNVSAAEICLAEIMKRVKRELPELHLSTVIQNNEQIEQMLADNRIDFAVYDGVRNRSTRSSALLFTDSMLAVCSPSLYEGTEIGIEQLAAEPLLLREKGSGLRNCVDGQFLSHGFTAESAAESISTLSLIELAEIGAGFAVLPERLANRVCDGVKLKSVQVTDADFKRYYYLVCREKKHLTPMMKAFTDLITGSEF